MFITVYHPSILQKKLEYFQQHALGTDIFNIQHTTIPLNQSWREALLITSIKNKLIRFKHTVSEFLISIKLSGHNKENQLHIPVKKRFYNYKLKLSQGKEVI